MKRSLHLSAPSQLPNMLALPLMLLLLAVFLAQPAKGAGMNYMKAGKRDTRYLPLVSSPPPPSGDTQYPLKQEPWSALVMALSQLLSHMVEPYVPLLPDLDLDWATVMQNANILLDKTAPNIGPLKASVVGMAAMAVPIVMQVARSVVESVADLLDNTIFVMTGHTLGRRSVPQDVTEELTDVILRLVHLVTRHLGRR